LEADLLSSLDSVPEACHYRSMANLPIKNFPDALHLGDSADSLLEQERQHKTVLEHSK